MGVLGRQIWVCLSKDFAVNKSCLEAPPKLLVHQEEDGLAADLETTFRVCLGLWRPNCLPP